MVKTKKDCAFDWEDIKRLLPHRYPFLLIDRVIAVDRSEVKEGTLITGAKVHAMKCITGNEEMLQGHFPDKTILPGVMMIEMMAQCSMFVYPPELYGDEQLPLVYLSKVEKCRFRSLAKPGDILDIHCYVEKERRGFATFQTHIIERQSQAMVCDATLMAFFDTQTKT